MNSIVLTEKLWAAEGAIVGKFILYTAFRINFYCLSLIFHNKYYKRYIFPSRYLAVVPMVIEKLSKSYHATVFFLIISHLPPGHPIISSEFKMAAVSVKRSIVQFATRNCLHEGTCKQNNCNLPNESSHDLNWVATRM